MPGILLRHKFRFKSKTFFSFGKMTLFSYDFVLQNQKFTNELANLTKFSVKIYKLLQCFNNYNNILTVINNEFSILSNILMCYNILNNLM